MKVLWSMLPTVIKAVLGVVAFLIGLGWAAFLSVNTIVKAEAEDLRKEFMEVRGIDMGHLNNRMRSMDAKLDILIERRK